MTSDDEDRAAILARRSRLIGLALSGIAVTAGCDDRDPPPGPCLSAPIQESDPGPAPMPCLSPVSPEEPETPPEEPEDPEAP